MVEHETVNLKTEGSNPAIGPRREKMVIKTNVWLHVLSSYIKWIAYWGSIHKNCYDYLAIIIVVRMP